MPTILAGRLFKLMYEYFGKYKLTCRMCWSILSADAYVIQGLRGLGVEPAKLLLWRWLLLVKRMLDSCYGIGNLLLGHSTSGILGLFVLPGLGIRVQP